MKCLSLSRLISYRNELLDENEIAEITQHLESCAKCQKMMKDYLHLTAIVQYPSMARRGENKAECLNEIQLLDYLENHLSGSARREITDHLVECPDCMDELISLEKFLNDLKSENLLPVRNEISSKIERYFQKIKSEFQDKITGTRWLFHIPRPVYYAAATIILLIILVGVLDHQQFIPNATFQTREPAVIQNMPPIQLLSPSDRSTINSEIIEFSWTQVPNTDSYNILLLSEQGDIIWEENTPNIKLRLPPEIHLKSSTTYFWQVECLLEHGGSIVSDMASFRLNNK
ncbi:MAG: zf-HC2 domain-containing protein [Calditrichaeota bacterium]|nr:zf-HC2 domain-containing protein [Calditrichota bacterium]